MDKINKEVKDKGIKGDIDNLMEQFSKLEEMQHIKNDEIILGSVTSIINNLIANKGSDLFTGNERKKIIEKYFKILNKYS